MTKVLIAVDSSDTSIRAARTAHNLFGDDAEYTVVSVAPLDPVIWGEDTLAWGTPYSMVRPPMGSLLDLPRVTTMIEQAAQIARNVADSADVSGARAVGDDGDPVEAILAAASAYEVDVIVVGSHDRGWFTRLLSPSTASAVVRRADLPVLVAR